VARKKKLKYFLPMLQNSAGILDVGCADNWFKAAAAERGWTNVTSIDLTPPADIVGDIFDWPELGLAAHSFDAIVAFEFVEHGDFSQPLHDLLKPDGVLMVTTPVPKLDAVCRVFERLHLLQPRDSPHTHLIDVGEFPRFTLVNRRVKAVISQWAVLRPE
jgi:2-polyprenyl-3-methyl-5-hydroxy-6-metoxy-1,4-benzoquinol methylase